MARGIRKNGSARVPSVGPFLNRVSRDLSKDVRIREDLSDDVVASSWLGYEGASEEEIAALEKRLGKRLLPNVSCRDQRLGSRNRSFPSSW
jgi:hypothetical protein